MKSYKWAVSKITDIVVKPNTNTKSVYKVLSYKALRTFKTQRAARLYRASHTGRIPVQVVNIERSVVSR